MIWIKSVHYVLVKILHAYINNCDELYSTAHMQRCTCSQVKCNALASTSNFTQKHACVSTIYSCVQEDSHVITRVYKEYYFCVKGEIVTNGDGLTS